jgi:hypothetical protein
VAFKVGPKTSYKYIIVNIHYLKTVKNDKSGLAITVGSTARRYQAGIMLLISGNIAIPPRTPKFSSKFSCKYTGRTLQVFAFRVHAHAHGDANTAYRVRQHEWAQVARGDPQWPQAFYPTDAVYDVKDGDMLVGQCTYHNDADKYVYAGSTHTDEMCNVYLMYYTDAADEVMEVCSGNTYPALESVIPAEAEQRPAPLATFNSNNGNAAGSPMSHHDMEGSKIHSGGDKKQPAGAAANQASSLAYLLAQAGLGNGAGGNSDDYYDDVEQARSKGRGNSADSADDLQSLFDPDSDPSSDDYSDPASTLLLAAELAKLSKKTNNNNNNNNNNNAGGDNKLPSSLTNKIKNQLSNLGNPTLSSKTLCLCVIKRVKCCLCFAGFVFS